MFETETFCEQCNYMFHLNMFVISSRECVYSSLGVSKKWIKYGIRTKKMSRLFSFVLGIKLFV